MSKRTKRCASENREASQAWRRDNLLRHELAKKLASDVMLSRSQAVEAFKAKTSGVLSASEAERVINLYL